MTEWPKTRLGSVTDLRSGFAFKSSQWRIEGIPVVKIANVKHGSLDLSGCSFVSAIDAKNSRFLLSKGDILIGLTGHVGSVCKVPNNEPLALNQRVGVFRPNADAIEADFLYMLVFSENFKNRVISAAYGSAQPNVSPRQILDFDVSLPPIKEQREIAAILGALDNKIELNRKTAATLEEMARALYRSWFVDFDPVHAKAAGLAPAHMDTATAALFPDRFGDDGLPEGWAEKPLSSVADFLNGAALQKFPPIDGEEGLPVIKIAQLRNGLAADGPRASSGLPAKYKIRDGDVLFSWSGSLLQKVWTGGLGALNQHLFKVSSTVVPKWFHYFAVDQHMIEFQAIAASKATTMGHIQRHHLDDALIVIPPPKIMKAADQIIEKLFDRSFQLQMESQTLATLRDTLLPRLMSGELRVGEAVEQVEEAI